MSSSLWNPRQAAGLRGPNLCAYASRLIGGDPELVLWGGGNSSIKTVEKDHAGRRTRVLWVKASGYDMKTITAEGFAPLRLDELALLRGRKAMSDEDMVSYQMRCLLDPKAAKPSIETLLHAWVPAPHVYHTHADAVAGFTCTPDSRERTLRVFGGDVLWVPYVRPGFDLARSVAAEVEKNPKAKMLILDKHGALTWGEEAQAAYEAMLRLTREALRYQAAAARPGRIRFVKKSPAAPASARRERALRVLPWLRGLAGASRRVVVRWTDSPEVLDFLNRPDAEKLTQKGPFSPDHTLQTKARPLFWTMGSGAGRGGLEKAMARYRRWYETYFKHHAPEGTPRVDPYPRVILIPEVGLFTTGKDHAQAGIPQEIYLHTIAVLKRIAAFTDYTPLDLRHLGDIEFWPLETYKYRLLPPESEFSRRVALVTGAAGAIGARAAERFCAAGASVVLADIDFKKAGELAADFNRRYGSGRAWPVLMDVTSESGVRKGFEEAVLRYGGLDVLFSNAGIAKSASVEKLALSDWERSFQVNATGHFLCAREAMRVFKAQGIGGAIVFNASKNVLAPGKEFAAYSAAKAAQVQLARVLALEAGEIGVRVNVVNPDAVFEGSGLWTKAVREARAKAQGIDPRGIEEFYAQRNILKARVTADDVAQAVLFLSSERSSKTTGALLPVDGGLREAFPR